MTEMEIAEESLKKMTESKVEYEKIVGPYWLWIETQALLSYVFLLRSV